MGQHLCHFILLSGYRVRGTCCGVLALGGGEGGIDHRVRRDFSCIIERAKTLLSVISNSFTADFSKHVGASI